MTRYRWEDAKANIKAETCEIGQSRKRKRSVFESDHPGDETVLGNGWSRRVWGVVKTYSRLKQQLYYIRREDLK